METRDDLREELPVAAGICARCKSDADEDGFCFACGAVTLGGRIRTPIILALETREDARW